MAEAVRKKVTAERILDAAEHLFAQQGYSATSTRQIADRAGISIQTLHYHCGSKQELYNRIIERSVLPVTVMINGHIQEMLKLDLHDEAVLRGATNNMIDELFDVLAKNPSFPLLFFRQWVEQDPELRRSEWEQIVPFLRRWISQIESKVAGDRRMGIDLPLTFSSLSMLYWGLFTNQQFIGALLEMDPGSKEFMQRLKSHAKELTSRLLARIAGP